MRNSPATARDELLDWTDEDEPLSAPVTASSNADGMLRTGVLTLLLVAVVTMGISELFYWTLRAEIRKKQGAPVNAQLIATQSRDRQRLSRYQWVKKSEGVLRIPVSVAEDLVIADYANKPTAQDAPHGSSEVAHVAAARGGLP